MSIVYAAVAVVFAIMLTASGMMKVRRDPRSTRIIHDVVGVPLEVFPILAACEFAGALGLLAGIIRPSPGIAASVGLVAYFVGAVVGHLRVGDVKGLGPAAFMLFLSAACLILRAVSR
jgi:hypothetical protein